ncbi:protein of unknown function [Mucilaginibacter mallensis]|uniref:DUF4397 domain-containing protein n=1 Tax=Mucilaginibacter mallensis TaxID=652787 RepID=A0A1H1QX36_MUCMA|nr:DUF4397 domain-containing protein [Mucilaginibacter mallensis]SDS27943.1 protein of unknown function [Mucilaginibacter mallensis]
MISKSNKGITFILALFITVVLIMPFVSSCGKGGAASSVGLNTQMQVFNLGPDIQSVYLYVNYLKQGSSSYAYPNASGYFYLSTLDTPMQVRSAAITTATINFINLDTVLKAGHKYSLFITGLYANKSVTSILTQDDAIATPAEGYGKIRFVNASLPINNQLNITVNGTLDTPFIGVKYKAVTHYIQIPAGNYNFQLSQTSTPTVYLPNTNVQSITIQDSRLYTIYTYGIIGRATTDTSAFGAAVVTNR